MSEDQLPTLSFKVILVGESGVGKTSLANQMVNRQFTANLQPTIGTGIFKTIVSVGNTNVRLNIWDTAGHERFKSIIPMYCKDTSICVLVASIDNEESIQKIQEWKELVKKHVSPGFVVAINKMDLKDEHPDISVEDLRDQLLETYSHVFFVSAKTADNVQELFTVVARECLALNEPFDNPNSISIDKTNSKKSCC